MNTFSNYKSHFRNAKRLLAQLNALGRILNVHSALSCVKDYIVEITIHFMDDNILYSFYIFFQGILLIDLLIIIIKDLKRFCSS